MKATISLRCDRCQLKTEPMGIAESKTSGWIHLLAQPWLVRSSRRGTLIGDLCPTCQSAVFGEIGGPEYGITIKTGEA